MPSDSGSRRAASGGALERRKMATARRSRTAASIQSVLRVRLCMSRQRYPITPGGVGDAPADGSCRYSFAGSCYFSVQKFILQVFGSRLRKRLNSNRSAVLLADLAG